MASKLPNTTATLPHTTTTPPDTMAASTKVFSLPELLEPIILHLPLAKILQFQRVSTKWRDIVQCKWKAILAAKCAIPSKAPLNDDLVPRPSPLYAKSDKIVMNKTLNAGSRKKPSTIDASEHYFLLETRPDFTKPYQPIDLLRQIRDQYVSMPFCQAVLLALYFDRTDLAHERHEYRRLVKCTVYVKTGVKIGHLLDAYADLFRDVISVHRVVKLQSYGMIYVR